MRIAKLIFIFVPLFLFSGCQTVKPIHTVDYVDLNRFMGDWYVIASIPTFIEKGAFNAIESYRLDNDGTVATTFRFNKGSHDGPRKEYHPRGFIRDKKSNAVWDMQFIWPFKTEYRIIFLSKDYTKTVIGRSKRDYVWIMAREKNIPNDDYEEILEFLRDQDYTINDLRKFPHGSSAADEAKSVSQLY